MSRCRKGSRRWKQRRAISIQSPKTESASATETNVIASQPTWYAASDLLQMEDLPIKNMTALRSQGRLRTQAVGVVTEGADLNRSQ